MKKRSRLTVCLVAGVLVLAVSVSAALGSVSGYSRYKDAVRNLLTETDNFTAHVETTVSMDGKPIEDSTVMDFMFDGSDYYTRQITSFYGGTSDARVECQVGDTQVWFDEGSDYYWSNPADPDASPLLGTSAGDEYSDRLMNFAEVLADTVVGDLKNNVVLTGSENGLDTYTVDISRNQVPTLISSGLSLLACTIEAENSGAEIQYDDYTAAAAAWYEKQTGEKLTEEFMIGYIGKYDDDNFDWDAWYETYGELSDAVWTASNDMDDYYRTITDEMGDGVLYVRNDGSYTKYDTYEEYYLENTGSADFNTYRYIGDDLALDHVNCVFTVDEDGRLRSNEISVTFTCTDTQGNSHEFLFTLSAELSDFGTTTVTMPDLSGMRQENEGDLIVDATAEDDGVAYEITVD